MSETLKICRTCRAGDCNINLLNLTNQIILEKLKICTPITITEDDGLPHYICDNCLQRLNDAFSFRIQCEMTEKKLRKSLSCPTIEIVVVEESGNEEFLELENKEEETFNFNDLNNEENDDKKDVKKLNRKSRKGPFDCMCIICAETFRDAQALKKHNEVHKLKAYRCSLCERQYVSDKVLRTHMVDCHKTLSAVFCFECACAYPDKQELNEHKENSENQIGCRLCNERFATYCQMNTHFWVHEPPIDRNTVNRKKYSMKHKRSPVVCSICGKISGNIYRHEAHLRTHTNERPFSCRFCNKSFKTRQQNTSHEYVHTDKRPYKCETCGATFRQFSHLINHNGVHSSTRSYLCRFCNKTFRQKGNLTAHERIHTGESKNLKLDQQFKEVKDIHKKSGWIKSEIENENEVVAKSNSSALNSTLATQDVKIIVRTEEVLILFIVLLLWVGAIVLFFNRWGKIRMLEPYQPKFQQESRASCPLIDVPARSSISRGSISVAGPSFATCPISYHSRRSRSVAYSKAMTISSRPRLNSVIVGSLNKTMRPFRKTRSDLDIPSIVQEGDAV